MTVYGIHGIDNAKLAKVIDDMKSIGAPTLRVVDCGDYYQAIEGNHRLAAAIALDITPDFIVLDQNDIVDAESIDLEDLQGNDTVEAWEIVDYIGNTDRPVYKF